MPITWIEALAPRALAPPTGSYRWSQQWRDVLFLHWPAPHDWLRDRLPPQIEIDMFAGQAWVSFVGFRLEQVRLRGWPAIPLCSGMLELNLRTYVRYRGEPAIYFLTMHADHRLMIAAARLMTPLPYSLATIDYAQRGDCLTFACTARRTGRRVLAARFRPVGRPSAPTAGTLDAWLVERYVAYAGDPAGRLFRMPVTHEPWRVQETELTDWQVTGLGGEIASLPPRCHFSPGVAALLWPLTLV